MFITSTFLYNSKWKDSVLLQYYMYDDLYVFICAANDSLAQEIFWEIPHVPWLCTPVPGYYMTVMIYRYKLILIHSILNPPAPIQQPYCE